MSAGASVRQLGQEICRYLDSRVAADFLPAQPFGDVSKNLDGGQLFVGIKPARGNSPDDFINLIFVENKRGTVVLTMTDGDPFEIARVLITAALYDATFHPVSVYNTAQFTDSEYLVSKGLFGGLFLHPDTSKYTRRVAHLPRSLGYECQILLVVFLTQEEHRIARADVNSLFDRFTDTGRDLMTVNAPYLKPSRIPPASEHSDRD